MPTRYKQIHSAQLKNRASYGEKYKSIPQTIAHGDDRFKTESKNLLAWCSPRPSCGVSIDFDHFNFMTSFNFHVFFLFLANTFNSNSLKSESWMIDCMMNNQQNKSKLTMQSKIKIPSEIIINPRYKALLRIQTMMKDASKKPGRDQESSVRHELCVNSTSC